MDFMQETAFNLDQIFKFVQARGGEKFDLTILCEDERKAFLDLLDTAQALSEMMGGLYADK